MFGSLNISTSGLTAQRIRMDVIAGNLASMDVTADADGRPNPYRRQVAVFAPGDPSQGRDVPGVHVAKIARDMSDFKLVHDPYHPHAMQAGPKQGYVRYPNVDAAHEMVDMIEASRAYEANATAFEVSKAMMAQSLRLLA